MKTTNDTNNTQGERVSLCISAGANGRRHRPKVNINGGGLFGAVPAKATALHALKRFEQQLNTFRFQAEIQIAAAKRRLNRSRRWTI